jgi:hypothetical protein
VVDFQLKVVGRRLVAKPAPKTGGLEFGKSGCAEAPAATGNVVLVGHHLFSNWYFCVNRMMYVIADIMAEI